MESKAPFWGTMLCPPHTFLLSRLLIGTSSGLTALPFVLSVPNTEVALFIEMLKM